MLYLSCTLFNYRFSVRTYIALPYSVFVSFYSLVSKLRTLQVYYIVLLELVSYRNLSPDITVAILWLINPELWLLWMCLSFYKWSILDKGARRAQAVRVESCPEDKQSSWSYVALCPHRRKPSRSQKSRRSSRGSRSVVERAQVACKSRELAGGYPGRTDWREQGRS